MTDIQTTANTMAAKVASGAQWGGAGSAVFSGGARILGLTTDEWTVVGIVAGILVGLAGLALNWFYKHQHLKLAVKRLQVDED